jgi:nucleotide-binding universal stress UspA family protein
MTRHPIRNILVPTDFSADAEVAFAHALRLAVAARADLHLLHVEPRNDQADWRWAPRVVETLVRWGVLEPGSTPADLDRIGGHARRSLAVGERPEAAILHAVAEVGADLVVMASHGRTGLDRWLRPSVSRPVLLERAAPVLLLPPRHRGFVDADSGETTLSRVLVPIDATPAPGPAFAAATLLADALGNDNVQIATLHVGSTRPEVSLPMPDPPMRITHWNTTGPVVDEILAAAGTWQADLLVTVSEGRCDMLDHFLGSTMERLAARTRTPMLVLPAGWGAPRTGARLGEHPLV